MSGDSSPSWNVVATDDGSFTLAHFGHGECYHSRAGALAEANALYLQASGICDIWKSPQATSVSVLDVGLGLGYNAVLTLEAWLQAATPGNLNLVSLEVDADLVRTFASGEAPWQVTWPQVHRSLARTLLKDGTSRWAAKVVHPSRSAEATWQVSVGDATQGTWTESAPAFGFIWQDPFSPEKNPTLWDQAWFSLLRAHSTPQSLLMTYSVARQVRDALSAAGWRWEKIPATLSAKRHWLKASPSTSCGHRSV